MSNVPSEFIDLEKLSQADLDREIQRYRSLDPKTISDEDLTRCVAIHAIARRKTSGPPKPSAARVKKEPLTLDDLGLGL